MGGGWEPRSNVRVTARASAPSRSYIKRFLGAPTDVDVDALKAESERLKQENEGLKKQVAELNAQLDREEA